MVRATDVLLFNVLLLTISSKGIAETLLCVICSSDKDQDCESNPPNPKPCPETTKQSACQTVRELDQNGKVTKFIRSCSSIRKEDNKEDSGCHTHAANNETEVCYKLCYSDGCNASGENYAPTFLLVTCLVSIIMLHLF